MFHPIDKYNVRLRNDVYVYLNIKSLQNVPSHQMIIKNGESKYISMKKVIVYATTAKIRWPEDIRIYVMNV